MNLLFVDLTIPSLNTFLDGVNQNSCTITYSIEDTFDSLKEKIDKLQINRFDNIGFVFTDEQTPLKMFVSYNTFMSYNNNGIIENNTTKFIKDLVTNYSVKKLDFLACNLLSYPEWKNYFNYLMKENEGLIVRASNDRTGNLISGGDWILESTNEDVSNLYFNNNINNWNELLDASSSDVTLLQDIDRSLIGCGSNNYGNLNTDSKNQLSFSKKGEGINMVSCGYLYTMIIKSDGSVWGCGSNSTGQLGDGTNVNKKVFTRENTNITNAISISCGSSHTMIIKSDGSIWGCGYNNAGQLGDGTTINRYSFTRENTNITNAISISCGGGHTMIIKSDRSIWGCGGNTIGQLGDGTSTNRYSFTRESLGINNAISIACGIFHTMIIRDDGINKSVWGCGVNNAGQLGDGTTTNRYSFTRENTNMTNAESIACSASNGRYTLIIKSDGSVWGCGQNTSGELGDGTTTNRYSFTRENTNMTNAVSIACSSNYTMIIKSDGTVWGRGVNNLGQLGDGTITNRYSFIRESSGITDAVSIACGDNHTMIIRYDGTTRSVWGCGDNQLGQLNSNYIIQNLSKLYIDNSILCISNGGSHTMIIKSDGSVWGRGLNNYGQLGDGTTIAKNVFTRESSGITDAVSITCGSYYTMIIRYDGATRSVWGCGDNQLGQIGDGTTIAKNVFTRESSGITDAVSIDCGSEHTMIIKSDDSVWGCGSNYTGQLGDGTTTHKYSFTRESSGITDAVSITCGTYHTMIIRYDGATRSVWGCGHNIYGQLGDGTTVNKKVFTRENTNITNAISISCGSTHTMIIKSDGSIWGCGQNTYGQLGDGTSTNRNSFTRENTNITNAVSIYNGFFHTMIIKSDDSVWGCGRNNNGQLGDGTIVNKNIFINVNYNGKAKLSKYIKSVQTSNDFSASKEFSINIPTGISTYFPISTTKTITAIDYSANNYDLSFFKNSSDKLAAIKIGPDNTVFNGHIDINIKLDNVNGLIIYQKSELSETPVRLIENESTSNAYYTVDSINNIVTIKTTHFTEYGIGNGNFCLLKGTCVLTPNGYLLIEELKRKDIIITGDNREVPIKAIFRTIINSNKKPDFIPYKIAKNSIAENYPSEDTYLSGYHMIKYGDNWIQPNKCNIFEKDLTIKEIEYYHVQLENFETDNLVVNGGLIVESLGNGSNKDSQIWVDRSNNSIII